MRFLTLTFAAAAAAIQALAPQMARAGVVVTVDKSAQRVSVAVDGRSRYTWPTSTARRGYVTPNGTYRPQRLARHWYSRKYHNSPMPYSIFFRGGYAVHGSYAVSRLGTPASHGCVRLNPKNAAVLFALVKEHGTSNTRIIVTGSRPSPSHHRISKHREREGRTIAYRSTTERTRVYRARTNPYRFAADAPLAYARRHSGFFGLGLFGNLQ